MIHVENAVDGALLFGSIVEPLGIRHAVLKAMRGRLDVVFLRSWADRLRVRAELERALVEAGYEEPDGESRT